VKVRATGRDKTVSLRPSQLKG